jgi:hypothetical protein
MASARPILCGKLMRRGYKALFWRAFPDNRQAISRATEDLDDLKQAVGAANERI